MKKPDVDIRALASLSRLDVSEKEVAKLEKEIPDILAFVEEIQKANISREAGSPKLRNVVRPDQDPHETGLYTERILSAAPAQKGGRVVVKQVVSRKKN